MSFHEECILEHRNVGNISLAWFKKAHSKCTIKMGCRKKLFDKPWRISRTNPVKNLFLRKFENNKEYFTNVLIQELIN